MPELLLQGLNVQVSDTTCDAICTWPGTKNLTYLYLKYSPDEKNHPAFANALPV